MLQPLYNSNGDQFGLSATIDTRRAAPRTIKTLINGRMVDVTTDEMGRQSFGQPEAYQQPQGFGAAAPAQMGNTSMDDPAGLSQLYRQNAAQSRALQAGNQTYADRTVGSDRFLGEFSPTWNHDSGWSEPMEGDAPYSAMRTTVGNSFGNPQNNGFAERLAGNQEVMPLQSDPVINDPRFQKFYQHDPQAASSQFERERGYGMDLARSAGALGGKMTANQAMVAVAQARAQQKRTPEQMLRQFEQNYGVNPVELAQDYVYDPKNNNDNGVMTGSPQGYDPKTQTLWSPGGAVKGSDGDYINKPSRHIRVTPQVRAQILQAMQGSAMSGDFSYGAGGSSAYGYDVQSKLDPDTDSYFKSHPEVAGMAMGGGENGSDPGDPRTIGVNPYNQYMGDPTKRSGLIRIEAARHLMSEMGYTPKFQITPKQRQWQGGLGAYSGNDDAFKKSIISRILSGDEVPDVTPEQKMEAEQVAASLGQSNSPTSRASVVQSYINNKKQSRLDELKRLQAGDAPDQNFTFEYGGY